MKGNVGVGVSALVVVEGKLLMTQRTGAHGAGTWCTPGGWIDVLNPNAVESPEEAAVREVLEETGVVVVPESKHDDTRYALTWPTVDGTHSYDIWVPCRYVSGEAAVQEPDKSLAVRWVPLADVRDLLLFPHLYHYIMRYGLD